MVGCVPACIRFIKAGATSQARIRLQPALQVPPTLQRILRMPCCTFPTTGGCQRTFSAQAIMGCMSLQGPHQLAQKSTSTGTSDCGSAAEQGKQAQLAERRAPSNGTPALPCSAAAAAKNPRRHY